MSLFNEKLQDKTGNYIQMQTISGYFSLIVGISAFVLLIYVLTKCVQGLGDFGFLKSFAHYLGY